LFENHTKNVWVLFKKPKLVAIAAKQKKIGTNWKDQMMQDNTPINFYIKHFFKNCQIKKLQPIFDTFVPPCIIYQGTDIPGDSDWYSRLYIFFILRKKYSKPYIFVNRL
jgi:hypothetical protein